jgi:hypothetical protein
MRNVNCPSAELSHAELTRLIGEIDGIDLEGHNGRLFVNLRIGGKTIEVISDSGDNPSHHITREGVRAVLSQANASDQATASEELPQTRQMRSEPLPASDLFAPCEGCSNAKTCRAIGCIAKELEETL